MTYAATQDWVVVTHAVEFGAILATTGGAKPSVVQIRTEDVSARGIGDLVIRALRQMRAELERGALLTIEPRRARLRILPFREP